MKEWIEKLKAALKKLGKTDEEINAVTSELEKNTVEPPSTPNVSDPNIKLIVDQNNALSQQVKDLLTVIAEEKTQRQKSIEAQTEIDKANKEKKIKDAVDNAIKEGKFPEGKREYLTKLANNDFSLFEETVKDAPVDKHFKSAEKGKEGDKGKAGEQNNYSPATPLERVSNVALLNKVKEFSS